jgi:splicing factor 3B subunit 3
MQLYHLTLQRATSITAAAYGNFSAPKAHEVVVARGGVLELLRADEAGRLQSVLSTESFSTLRALLAVRLLGQTTDYLAVTSDSGRLSLLQYSREANAFVRLQLETFGKSGVRRTTPGQFLAKDPHGRALLVASVERQKFVYQLNRDASNALAIAGPLEAHRSRAIVFDAVGLDNGFENPLFCCLEVEYPEEGGEAGAAAAAAAAEGAGPPP